MDLHSPFHNDHEEPSLLAMVGLVAAVVASVILIFSGLGYVVGKLFL